MLSRHTRVRAGRHHGQRDYLRQGPALGRFFQLDGFWRQGASARGASLRAFAFVSFRAAFVLLWRIISPRYGKIGARCTYRK